MFLLSFILVLIIFLLFNRLEGHRLHPPPPRLPVEFAVYATDLKPNGLSIKSGNGI
jgi:hypothetical protein